MSFSLYKHTDDGVFDDFPKISDLFAKISEDFSKLFRRPDERPRIFSKTFRRCLKNFGEGPKMIRWYTNEFKYNLREKLEISEIIDIFMWEYIFTYEDIVSFLSICYHSVYHWLLYNNIYFNIYAFFSFPKHAYVKYRSLVNLY